MDTSSRFDLQTVCCQCKAYRYVTGEGEWHADGWTCAGCTRIARGEPDGLTAQEHRVRHLEAAVISFAEAAAR